jgi:hypothetical protein
MSDFTKPSSLSTPGDLPTGFKPDITVKPLVGDELVAAVDQLNNLSFIKKFPSVDRNFADPSIHLQQIGLFSFIPAQGATPDKNGIFGFGKMRGNFSTEQEASDRAEMIIREVDSAHTVFHTYVGRPFPITLKESYAEDTEEIDIRKQTTQAISSSIKQKKKDDASVMQEINDQEKKLMADVSDEPPDADSILDDYVTQCVKKAQLSWTYMEHIKKLKEVKALIISTRIGINESDVADPTLKDSFYERYTAARKTAGLKLSEADLKDGFMRYLLNDVSLPGIDTETKLVDIIESDTTEVTRVFQSEETPDTSS